MWKVFEQIKEQWQKDEKDLESRFEDDQAKNEKLAQLMETTLIEGEKLIQGNDIVSPCDGKVVAVNEAPEGIEIYFGDDYSVRVEFLLIRPLENMLVAAGDTVKTGQPMIHFNVEPRGVQVYLITPEIESKYRYPFEDAEDQK